MNPWESMITDLARMQVQVLQLLERTSLLYEKRAPLMMEYYRKLQEAQGCAMVLTQALREEPLITRDVVEESNRASVASSVESEPGG